jgi:glutathione S-transferase
VGQLAIADYLAELKPEKNLFPAQRLTRAHCRSICGEMHSGFANLRAALPMNLKAHFPGFKVWAGAKPDIDRIVAIWLDCLSTYGGPFLFGEASAADAMFAPVCARFTTYDVALDPRSAAYCEHVMAWPFMRQWIEAARQDRKSWSGRRILRPDAAQRTRPPPHAGARSGDGVPEIERAVLAYGLVIDLEPRLGGMPARSRKCMNKSQSGSTREAAEIISAPCRRRCGHHALVFVLRQFAVVDQPRDDRPRAVRATPGVEVDLGQRLLDRGPCVVWICVRSG